MSFKFMPSQFMKVLALPLVGLWVLASAGALANNIIPSPPTLNSSGYILMDANSGRVLVEHNADQRLPPASLTKLMTSYVLSYELEQGKVKNEDLVTISRNAWAQNPVFGGSSLMWIEVGTQVPLGELHKGIVVSSGNDASVAVAEHLAGSEAAFADVMNQHAQLIGMKDSHFVNSHGLPDPNHYMTTRDLALLSRALMKFPAEFSLYSLHEYTWNNITTTNRNRLLFRDSSFDGLKTGHTQEAGYCLVASANRGGMRLVSVVMGSESQSARERETQELMQYGFRYFETQRLYGLGDTLNKAQLWAGASDSLALGVEREIYLTIPRGSANDLQAAINVDAIIKAPVSKGSVYGELVVKYAGEELLREPLVALESVDSGGFFKRLWHAIVLFFKSLF